MIRSSFDKSSTLPIDIICQGLRHSNMQGWFYTPSDHSWVQISKRLYMGIIDIFSSHKWYLLVTFILRVYTFPFNFLKTYLSIAESCFWNKTFTRLWSKGTFKFSSPAYLIMLGNIISNPAAEI